jgi:hypothetical protein
MSIKKELRRSMPNARVVLRLGALKGVQWMGKQKHQGRKGSLERMVIVTHLRNIMPRMKLGNASAAINSSSVLAS